MDASLNVLGTVLQPCSTRPLTGWFRDGCCNTEPGDLGCHTVCASMTEDFLEFLRSRGNDLVTPAPRHGFPGLVPGDCWCVCAASWREACEAGFAAPVYLERTHEKTLEIVPLEMLMAHAVGIEA